LVALGVSGFVLFMMPRRHLGIAFCLLVEQAIPKSTSRSVVGCDTGGHDRSMQSKAQRTRMVHNRKAAQRPHSAAPHAQRGELKASVNHALLGDLVMFIVLYMVHCFSAR